MARQSVSTIMSNVAATVNQDPTAPSSGSADFTLWLQFINRGQIEWAESYDWEETRRIFTPTIANACGATISLPLDFRKLSAPVIYYDGSTAQGTQWAEEDADRVTLHRPISADRFFYYTGDPSNGHLLIWNPATLPSGASISIPYYSMPTGLALSTDIPLMPDSEFLVNRTIAYVFEARSDPRYQAQEQKARERLLQMVENASLQKFNSYSNPIRVSSPEYRSGFRLGRN